MNISFNNHFFVGCMVSEIPRVSVFGYFPLRQCTILPVYLNPYGMDKSKNKKRQVNFLCKQSLNIDNERNSYSHKCKRQ